MPATVADGIGDPGDVVGMVGGHVEHDVPPPPGQRGHVRSAVADQAVYLGEQLGIRSPTGEDRDLPPGVEQFLDEMAAHELGAAEDECGASSHPFHGSCPGSCGTRRFRCGEDAS